MESNSNSITIIVPLKGREHYTRQFIKANIYDHYNYIFADGSLSDDHENIFKSINKQNITYIRFEADVDISNYLIKMNKVFESVTTPYSMTVDNDDFILDVGIQKLFNELNENENIIGTSGKLLLNKELENSKYSYPKATKSSAHLSDLCGGDGIRLFLKNYYHLWYSLYRTEHHQYIWSSLNTLKLKNIFLIEIMNGLLSISRGPVKFVDVFYYIRLINSSGSSAREVFEDIDNPYYDFILMDDFDYDVNRCSEYLSQNLGLSSSEIKKIIRKYYIKQFIRADDLNMNLKNYLIYTKMIPRKIINNLNYLMKPQLSLNELINTKYNCNKLVCY
jgi:glycosyltransferase domain-containing protein